MAGSSSRGGVRAMMQLVEMIREGVCIGITPDGPRGPKYKVKEGVIKLSQITQKPIYPLAYSATKYWRFESWDSSLGQT